MNLLFLQAQKEATNDKGAIVGINVVVYPPSKAEPNTQIDENL